MRAEENRHLEKRNLRERYQTALDLGLEMIWLDETVF